MNTADLIAIDTHTHLEVSCRNPFDNYGEEYDRAADKYFRSSKRPTMQETIDFYREKKIGFVNFTVDAETQLGRRRIPNEEIAEAAQKNSDIMIAFGSIDPHKGKMGGREARKLVEEYGVKGFKFHPTVQGFDVTDTMAWPIYEVIAEHKLPAVFHSGHSGIGSGMRCGGGLRLQNSNPMLLEDVAIAFPDMQIVVAHPSWPWQDEAISLAMHKPNIWIDLSGWSPKYFPPQLVQYANTLLKDRILFGSDFPLITPDRWLKDFEEAGFKDAVKPLILKQNAMRLLGLDTGTAAWRRAGCKRQGLTVRLFWTDFTPSTLLASDTALSSVAGLVGRAVQRHDAVLGVDVDRQALDVRVGDQGRLHLAGDRGVARRIAGLVHRVLGRGHRARGSRRRRDGGRRGGRRSRAGRRVGHGGLLFAGRQKRGSGEDGKGCELGSMCFHEESPHANRIVGGYTHSRQPEHAKKGVRRRSRRRPTRLRHAIRRAVGSVRQGRGPRPGSQSGRCRRAQQRQPGALAQARADAVALAAIVGVELVEQRPRSCRRPSATGTRTARRDS